MAATPQDYITFESMLTLGGASIATFVVCNAMQAAFNFNPKWLALIVALFISFTTSIYSNHSSGPDLLLAAINGCLIFLTAVGGSATVGSLHNGSSAHREIAPVTTKRGFADSWF